MTDLQKFEAVNKCETMESLSETILNIVHSEGNVNFDNNVNFDRRLYLLSRQAEYVVKFENGNLELSDLTCDFGIRQQAFYIKHSYIED